MIPLLIGLAVIVFIGGVVAVYWLWRQYKEFGEEKRKPDIAEEHTCAHEPLLELHGKKIQGSKRCKHCGLNESYWNR